MNEKHSPLPWHATEVEEGWWNIDYAKGERVNPVPIAVLDHHRDGYDPVRTVITPANARLIITAVNSHGRLIEALKACQLQLLQSNNGSDYAQEANEKARALLAELEKQP